MPKITSLTAGSPLLSDVLVGVDVTDTTMASTGTTKKYNRYDVDNQIFALQGVTNFTPAICATTGPLTATYSNGTSGVGATLTNATTQAAFSVDGISPALNSVILVKGQASAFQNGIYILTTVGSGSTNWVLTRSTSADQAAELTYGKVVLVAEGVTNANTAWQLTFTGSVTVGVTSLNFGALAFGVPPYVSLNGSYSLGGILYSTATQASVLAGTATALQMLQSGSSAAPTWSTATWPATTTANQLLYSSATNTVGGLATTARSTLTATSAGAAAWIAMTDGQVIVGSTAGSPAAAAITGSLGVTVTLGSNTIALSGNNMGAPTTVAATPYTVLTTDLAIMVDTSTLAITLRFPNTPTIGEFWDVKDYTGTAGTRNITLTTPGGSTTFDGATSYTLNSNFSAVRVYARTATAYAIL